MDSFEPPDIETFGDDILSQTPSEISYSLFGTYDAAAAMSAVRHEGRRILDDTTHGSSFFGQHIDQNADLMSQLYDSVDFELLEELYIQFDSKDHCERIKCQC